MFVHCEWEQKVGYPKVWVAGVDEVGRGCLAGPVVAAVLVLPETIDWQRDSWLNEVRDSKQLTAAQRKNLAPRLKAWALATALGSASVEEIDRINILQASLLAMNRAIEHVSKVRPLQVLVDGKCLPPALSQVGMTAVVQGDRQSLSIAGASIIAKVWRDDFMETLEAEFPGYGWAQHRGYPTVRHRQALVQLGVTPFHRRSFKTVAQL